MTHRTKQILAYSATALASLAIGAGIAGGSSSTSAAPTKTVTTTAPAPAGETTTETVEVTPAACRQSMQLQNRALGQMLKAGTIYAGLILPAYKAGAYGQSVAPITTKLAIANAMVERATGLVKQATPLAGTCLG